MRNFHCDHCGYPIFFENTICGNCGHQLAYVADLKLLVSLDPTGKNDAVGPAYTTPAGPSGGKVYRLCENYTRYQVCNGAVSSGDPNPLCVSCRLTRVIPDLSSVANRVAWYRLEVAKRRLIYSLIEHKLPILTRSEDPVAGLAFEFKADIEGQPRVLTGHDDGVITVNIDEADDVRREERRLSMHEPYRTLLGHFRHEIGHYYWDRLIKNSDRLEAFRRAFGDERYNYDTALKNHYANGPRPNWNEHFVSAYASVHPWEDWAETWAHYLHMTDTLETAASCGMTLQPDRKADPAMPKQPMKPAHDQAFDEIINNWFPLTYALNSLNRGMGLADAYPFVLSPAVVRKLRFVHETICRGSREEVCGDNHENYESAKEQETVGATS
jgi:hypothetical protein